MLRRSLICAFALVSLGITPCSGQDSRHEEADRLAGLLKWRPGSVVAEIGANDGTLTVVAARRVGPSGKVFSTEIDANALAHLKELAAKERNITVIKAAEADTNLPPACCDSIFMRLVYHHLTKPVEIDASLFQSLKPGGRLAVIDEEPYKGTSIPEGVPENRGGHGVPLKILISELTTAGFRVEHVYEDWPSRDAYHQIYCVLFRRTKN